MDGKVTPAESDVKPSSLFDAREVIPKNVSGSTAGASSGDFHVYRHQRRREIERVENMEREAEEKKRTEERLHVAEQRRLKEEVQTQRRAAKRRRKKELRKQRKKSRVTNTKVVPEEQNSVPDSGIVEQPGHKEETEVHLEGTEVVSTGK